MLELQALTGELAAKRPLDGWIGFYTESFAKVERHPDRIPFPGRILNV